MDQYSQAKRIRGRALQTLRMRLLSASPVCAMCRVAVATEVDHIVALTNGGGNEDDNLQCLCAECHEIKTLADLGQKPRFTTGIDGLPIVEDRAATVLDTPRGPNHRKFRRTIYG